MTIYDPVTNIAVGFLDGLLIGTDPIGAAITHFHGYKTIGGYGLRGISFENDKPFDSVDYSSRSYKGGRIVGVLGGLPMQVLFGSQLLLGILDMITYEKLKKEGKEKFGT